MFDFEKLLIYQKAKEFNHQVFGLITRSKNLDRTTKDQFRRASFSIMLNIAEGSGRVSKPDRSNFFIIARGSTFECAAIIDFLHDEGILDDNFYTDLNGKAEELSKMLYTMIRNLKTERERE